MTCSRSCGLWIVEIQLLTGWHKPVWYETSQAREQEIFIKKFPLQKFAKILLLLCWMLKNPKGYFNGGKYRDLTSAIQ